ncbi:MAG TPA: hypothetical protein PLJ43_02195 [Chitinophagales bacterium]|nr:hypothetical protein [Chitinophagales bacterium]HNA56895.1 hypothetical protein [Chitinophagales bacterium]
MLQHTAIGTGEVATTKTEVVDGVDQVCFTAAVQTVDKGESMRKNGLGRSIVFKVQEAYTAQ